MSQSYILKCSPLRNQALATLSFSSIACTISLTFTHVPQCFKNHDPQHLSIFHLITDSASLNPLGHFEVAHCQVEPSGLQERLPLVLCLPFQRDLVLQEVDHLCQTQLCTWHLKISIFETEKCYKEEFQRSQLTFWYLLDAISYFRSCNKAKLKYCDCKEHYWQSLTKTRLEMLCALLLENARLLQLLLCVQLNKR